MSDQSNGFLDFMTRLRRARFTGVQESMLVEMKKDISGLDEQMQNNLATLATKTDLELQAAGIRAEMHKEMGLQGRHMATLVLGAVGLLAAFMTILNVGLHFIPGPHP